MASKICSSSFSLEKTKCDFSKIINRQTVWSYIYIWVSNIFVCHLNPVVWVLLRHLWKFAAIANGIFWNSWCSGKNNVYPLKILRHSFFPKWSHYPKAPKFIQLMLQLTSLGDTDRFNTNVLSSWIRPKACCDFSKPLTLFLSTHYT